MPGPDFNVTHTAGTAVFAIGHGLAAGARLGVDVERAARTVDFARLARKLLTPAERDVLAALDDDTARLRFLRTWTCKEAMSKATGDGLRAPFDRIAVEPEVPPQLLEGPLPYAPPAWRLFRVPMPGDAIVTVALWQP
jgi:4'-phosphopantetheinyl transferase